MSDLLSIYRTRAITTRSRFEAALDYKPQIYLKNTLFLVHKLSAVVVSQHPMCSLVVAKESYWIKFSKSSFILFIDLDVELYSARLITNT